MSGALVAMQFLLLGLLAVRIETAGIGAPSVALLSASGGVGLWALSANPPRNFSIRPEPKVGGSLVTHGPYRLVRHPMYLALLLLAGAIAIAGDELQLLLWSALVAVLFAKARREERLMALAHAGYAEYRSRTRAIIPFLL